MAMAVAVHDDGGNGWRRMTVYGDGGGVWRCMAAAGALAFDWWSLRCEIAEASAALHAIRPLARAGCNDDDEEGM